MVQFGSVRSIGRTRATPKTMNKFGGHLIPLFEQCSLDGSSGPWKELLIISKELVSRCFLSKGGNSSDLEEFLDWLPAWMFSGRKIQALLRKRDKLLESDRSLSDDELEKFAENYFATIIMSGRVEFYVERNPTQTVFDRTDLELVPERTKDSPESNDSSRNVNLILEILSSLAIEIRVPFRLRYPRGFGPLTDDEIHWVSGRSGSSPEDVVRSLQQTLTANESKNFPFSSEFICDLIGICFPTKTDCNNIDQRIRRAKELIEKECYKRMGILK